MELHGKFDRSFKQFGRKMSDDQLLFLALHIYMWSAWLKVCTYMHMYFLVSKGFTLSVVTPGVLVKN